MKIDNITIGRKFNLGNYNTMDITFSVSVEEEEQTKEWEELLKDIAVKIYKKIIETKAEVEKQKEVM